MKFTMTASQDANSAALVGRRITNQSGTHKVDAILATSVRLVSDATGKVTYSKARYFLVEDEPEDNYPEGYTEFGENDDIDPVADAIAESAHEIVAEIVEPADSRVVASLEALTSGPIYDAPKPHPVAGSVVVEDPSPLFTPAERAALDRLTQERHQETTLGARADRLIAKLEMERNLEPPSELELVLRELISATPEYTVTGKLIVQKCMDRLYRYHFIETFRLTTQRDVNVWGIVAQSPTGAWYATRSADYAGK